MASFTGQAVTPSSMLPPPLVNHNPRRPLSVKDWEKQRAIIQRLYSAENKDLQEVMEIMEQEHGFRATYICLLFSALFSSNVIVQDY